MFDPIPDPISGKSILPWAVPVTRALNAIGDKVGAHARNERDRRPAPPLPWSFKCTIPEDENEERTGGWFNCRLQIGFDIDWHSPDLGPSGNTIGGTDLCDDGTHYLEVTLADGTENRQEDTAEIKIADSDGVPDSDYIGGIIRIVIGTVADGKLTFAPHFNPVIYKYV